MDSPDQIKGNIKAIDRSTVHRICSGQVILTLATAVKELVENSIDAGATNIEVKLKEYGKDLIEVSDNGSGVKPSDYQSLTLKHHTSKIGDFSDLPGVSTFGFRGEALSSLCALGKMTIITCHKDTDVGDRLEYDRDGILINQAPVARPIGTTIVIENLFSTLPVRYKEFIKNLKKEYGKMIQLLTGYCLISTGKRITCVNNTANGKKSINVLSTNGERTIRGNISCVYGSKQVANLMEFVQKPPSTAVLEEFNVLSVIDQNYKIEGFLSPSTHGEGRSTADRQFYFVNGRPCDLPKVAKVINDVYHGFNRHQYPFVCLNIELLKDNVDVNVTPDKRQVFIAAEKLLLATIKTSVLSMYERQPSTLNHCAINFPKLNNTFINPISPGQPDIHTKSPMLANLKRSCDDSELECLPVFKSPRLNDDSNFKACTENIVSNIDGVSNEIKLSDNSNNKNDKHNDCSITNSPLHLNHQNRSVENSIKTSSLKYSHIPEMKFCVTRPFKEDTGISVLKSKKDFIQSSLFKSKFSKETKNSYSFSDSNKSSSNVKPFIYSDLEKKGTLLSSPSKELDNDFVNQKHECYIKFTRKTFSTNSIIQYAATEMTSDVSCDKKHEPCDIIVDHYQTKKRKYVTLNFQMENIRPCVRSPGDSNASLNNEKYRKFRSNLNSKDAESELRKEISKDMFSKMEIIGQFNLGFIIAKYEDDLFIIDQHATDEKYNFEILQRDTMLETQKLLNPQTLEITADARSILLDNISIFEKNGFKFNVTENVTTPQCLQLISVPVSQNWSFGKDDVDELIFMLTDNSGKMCRPSRVRQMFASRACRKSVMVGTPLSHQLMKKLVYHMGEIEQPWNCPHGRPTMRHLFNMNLLQSSL